MNRQEAINLIREINQECKSIRGTSIMLKTPEETEINSKGYQVHLIMKADQAKMRCLEVVAAQYGYEVRTMPERGLVIVFNPPHKSSKVPEQGIA